MKRRKITSYQRRMVRGWLREEMFQRWLPQARGKVMILDEGLEGRTSHRYADLLGTDAAARRVFAAMLRWRKRGWWDAREDRYDRLWRRTISRWRRLKRSYGHLR